MKTRGYLRIHWVIPAFILTLCLGAPANADQDETKGQNDALSAKVPVSSVTSEPTATSSVSADTYDNEVMDRSATYSPEEAACGPNPLEVSSLEGGARSSAAAFCSSCRPGRVCLPGPGACGGPSCGSCYQHPFTGIYQCFCLFTDPD